MWCCCCCCCFCCCCFCCCRCCWCCCGFFCSFFFCAHKHFIVCSSFSGCRVDCQVGGKKSRARQCDGTGAIATRSVATRTSGGSDQTFFSSFFLFLFARTCVFLCISVGRGYLLLSSITPSPFLLSLSLVSVVLFIALMQLYVSGVCRMHCFHLFFPFKHIHHVTQVLDAK
jgi:hypothetical protein